MLTRTLEAPAPRRRWPWLLVPVAVVGLGVFAVWPWDVPLEEAARQPFLDFVVDLDAATSERSDLRRPLLWDGVLYEKTVAELRQIAGDERSWRRMDQAWATWGEVVTAVREAGLPEVVAGIPWVESRYTPELQSDWCAKGLWQFMPETAHRSGLVHGVPLRVEGCRFEDGSTWAPTEAGVYEQIGQMLAGTGYAAALMVDDH